MLCRQAGMKGACGLYETGVVIIKALQWPIEGLTATCAAAFGLTVLPAGCMGFLNPCKNASKYQATCGVFYSGIHTRVSLSLWR